ncbi:leucine-rich repeat domain, L domain-like protein [Artemisia annua]|uniref:Leucine-rich repeat domain, L domain-like protein n=1 Tax=Artemisia annua TaxID=35608 RepID=A0A2U1KX45_ARTAN|nr:leucine-rich repeat domain, L domain-like protein [Artemisia annua]
MLVYEEECPFDPEKITFDPEMSPLMLGLPLHNLAASSIEIEGMIKIQPIADVDETILCSLGWRNLEFIYKRRVGTHHHKKGAEGSQTQMYYEFGIFSTIYGGKVMPTWIRRRRKGESISFTIPSTPKKLRGLNLCYVRILKPPSWMSEDQDRDSEYPLHQLIELPDIKISNKTKNLTWIYKHYIERVDVGGKSLAFLSHWMFGENEMEDGDQLTISIKPDQFFDSDYNIRECGVSFVYDDDDGKKEKEEEALSYYKSWNHIIGGDLSLFHLTTGEYHIYNRDFNWYNGPPRSPFIENGVFYKGKTRFKAFSQKKSNKHGRALECYTSSMAKDLLVETDKYCAQPCEGDILCETCEKELPNHNRVQALGYPLSLAKFRLQPETLVAEASTMAFYIYQ